MTATTHETGSTTEVKKADNSVKETRQGANPHPETDHLMTEALSKELRVHAPGVGSLTFAPNQMTLTPEQRAAFASLGVDPNDPIAAAHCRRFVHVCQTWGLDPWGGEIHLVQRGKAFTKDTGEHVDTRTWTIQTGIDGYRRRGREASQGRWVGTAKWCWTGPDDDESSWRETTDPITGDIVMRRRWWEMWPESRGNPGAAKAVIQVYGDDGVLRTEEFIAHWEMYAPYEEEWTGYGNRRTKVQNPDGTPKVKLAKFWERGKAHMLAKCAESGLLRQQFAGVFKGVFTTEEMGRADADNKRDLEDAISRRRREAFREAQAAALNEPVPDPAAPTLPARAPAPVIQGAVETPAPTPERAPSEPVSIGEVIAQEVPRPQLSEADKVRFLLAEADWISNQLGQNFRQAITDRSGQQISDMTSEEMLRWIGSFRPRVISRLRAEGRGAEADVYEAWGPTFIGSVAVLTGVADPAADSSPAPEEGEELQPHPFDAREDDEARCSECDGFEDDAVHGGQVAAPPD